MGRIGRKASFSVSWACLLGLTAGANTRTIESPFALSADKSSECCEIFQVFSGGRIVIEATWNAQQKSDHPLSVALMRHDGSEAARPEIHIPLRIEYAIADPRCPSGPCITAPSWLQAKTADGNLRWRIVMFDQTVRQIAATPWRGLRMGTPGAAPRQ